MKLCDKITKLRRSQGLSQEELAERLGVSRQAVSKWESDASLPDIDKIILLSDYFEVTTDYLLKDLNVSDEDKSFSEQKFLSIKNVNPLLNFHRRAADLMSIALLFFIVAIQRFTVLTLNADLTTGYQISSVFLGVLSMTPPLIASAAALFFAFIISPTKFKTTSYPLSEEAKLFIEEEKEVDKKRNFRYTVAGVSVTLISIFPLIIYYAIRATETMLANTIQSFSVIFVNTTFIIFAAGAAITLNAILKRRAFTCFTPNTKEENPKLKKLILISWICVPILFMILGIATKRWDLTWIIFPLAIAGTEIINVLKNK